MAWQDDFLTRLAARPVCGYGDEATPATEPTALAALALVGAKQLPPAIEAAEFLLGIQNKDGSVGVRPGEAMPAWTTSLAVLTWLATERDNAFRQPIAAAVNWILETQGRTIEHATELGHNTKLIGWSWAADTHSWIEPTIFCTLALKAAGHNTHPRTREAIALLIDRQLSGGGCNYGNTTVLGQPLRPHLQPSGMLLVALDGEHDPSGRAAKSVNYVAQTINAETTPSSLAWAVLGLAAAGRKGAANDDLLAKSAADVLARGAAPYKLALLAHAALGADSPLVTLPRTGKVAP